MKFNKRLLLPFAETYIGALVSVGVQIYVSRQLLPAQIGVFQLSMVFVAVILALRDFGMTEYLVQEKSLTPESVRRVLGLNLMLTLCLAGFMFAMSDFVAAWFREPDIGAILKLLSFSTVLMPFASLVMALLRRELQFQKLFAISIGSVVVSSMVLFVSVYRGYGSYALAYGVLAGSATTFALAMMFKPPHVHLKPLFRGWTNELTFGWQAVRIYAFGQLARIYPDQLIGRQFNAASVAYFSRAGSVVEIFQQGFGKAALYVCLPVFSDRHRAGQSVHGSFAFGFSLFTAIGWASSLYFLIVSDIVIRLLFGPQWEQSIPLSRIVCIAFLFEISIPFHKELFIAVGRVKEAATLQIRLTLIKIACFTVGMFWGLQGGAIGLAVAGFLAFVVIALTFRARLHISMRENASIALRSLAVAFITNAAVLATVVGLRHFGYTSNALLLGVSAGVAMIAWLASMHFCKHPFWEVMAPLMRKALQQIGLKG